MSEHREHKAAALERLLSDAERALRSAVLSISKAAVAAHDLAEGVSSMEISAISLQVSRLAAELRGHRWTTIDPVAAVPPRPDLTVAPVPSQTVRCSRCLETMTGARVALAVGQEHVGCQLEGIWELSHG